MARFVLHEPWAGSAYFGGRQQIPIYQATSKVLLDNSKPTRNSQVVDDIQVSNQVLNTYAELFRSREAHEATIEELGYKPDVFAIFATPQEGTTLLNVRVESNVPQAAAFIANRLPEIVAKQQRLRQSSQYTAAAANLTKQLEDLGEEITNTQEKLVSLLAASNPSDGEVARQSVALSLQEKTYETLLQNLSVINFAEIESANLLAIVELADMPKQPIQPRVLLNTLLAALVGAMIGFSAGLVVEYLDDTIKSDSQIGQMFGVETLALIGRIEEEGERLLVHLLEHGRAIAEAYRMLRTNIRFASIDEPLRSLLITSPKPNEGKSTIAANLAVVLAQEGYRTILVDADLRRPVQHQIWKVGNQAGLTTALLERENAVTQYLHETDVAGLYLLPSGPLPPNPSELVGSQRMGELLSELTEQADFVVLDSPPVLAVADTSLLASWVSGVLLVLRANITNIEATRAALKQLKGVQAKVLGTILNDVRSSRDGYYYYNSYYATRSDQEGELSEKEKASLDA